MRGGEESRRENFNNRIPIGERAQEFRPGLAAEIKTSIVSDD